jgi:hypothetical protein
VPSIGTSGAAPLQLAPKVRCSDLPHAEVCIQPGTYSLDPAVRGGLVDVPAGWWEWNPGAGSVGLLVERPDIVEGSGWGLTIIQVGDVARDPCDPSAGTYAPADVDTPSELAAVMAAWPDFQATDTEAITIDGVEGVRTRLTSTATCPATVLWETPAGVAIDGYPMTSGPATADRDAYPADFRIITRDGQLLVIRSMAGAATSPFERDQGIADDPTRHAADLVSQQAIIDSIRFEDPAP